MSLLARMASASGVVGHCAFRKNLAFEAAGILVRDDALEGRRNENRTRQGEQGVAVQLFRLRELA